MLLPLMNAALGNNDFVDLDELPAALPSDLPALAELLAALAELLAALPALAELELLAAFPTLAELLAALPALPELELLAALPAAFPALPKLELKLLAAFDLPALPELELLADLPELEVHFFLVLLLLDNFEEDSNRLSFVFFGFVFFLTLFDV